jgi:PHD/YefM family antitoxin component YafN of YafNO toxin-antitoxin module
MAADVLDCLVPVSGFSRGGAARVFGKLRTCPRLIVLADDAPAAVILSPTEYARLAEADDDLRLLRLAESRMDDGWEGRALPQDEVMRRLGVSEADLAGAPDAGVA